jgi:hypothetical protein
VTLPWWFGSLHCGVVPLCLLLAPCLLPPSCGTVLTLDAGVGMAVPLVMTGVVNSLLFGMHYNFVSEIAKLRGHARATLSDTCAAAVASGALISIIVTPMEGIKARLQVCWCIIHQLSGQSARTR